MAFIRLTRVLLAALAFSACPSSASRLRRGNVKVHNATNATLPAASDDKAQVEKLRTKLQKVSAGLSTMLDPNGELGQSPVAVSLKAFSKELQTALEETKNATDSKKALQQLKDAQAGVSSLMKEMTIRQMRLMKDDDEQEQSLLLGVLMTRQNAPMEKQMEVLTSAEFEHLAVVKAILAKKDTKTALFKQVAEYLDSHGDKPAAKTEAAPLKKDKAGKPDVSPIVNQLQKRVDYLEQAEKHRAELHLAEMQKIEKQEAELAKGKDKVKHKLEQMKKSFDRKYKKESALSHKDVESLKLAIDAVKKGDITALRKAQAALQANLKAMESQNNGFTVLIQLAHRASGLDCPYCAAQCIEKCNAEGNSYTTCLTKCADAGK